MDTRSGDRGAEPGRLTRAAVARRLGVSVPTVRRMEGRVLHPERGEGRVRYFDEAEVDALAVHLAQEADKKPEAPRVLTEGEIAARLFPIFERGVSWLDAVVSTKLPPKEVRAAYWQWRQGFRREIPGTAVDVDAEPDEAVPAHDEKAFADWEAEMRALDREQERFARLSRSLRRR